MSVDTYLQRKDTSSYQVVEGEGVQVLVSPLLAQQAQWIHVDLQRFPLLEKSRRVRGDVAKRSGLDPRVSVKYTPKRYGTQRLHT